jgi:hypothetical protein
LTIDGRSDQAAAVRYELEIRLAVTDAMAPTSERASTAMRFNLGRGARPVPADLARIENDVHNAILDLLSKRRTYELPQVDGCGVIEPER